MHMALSSSRTDVQLCWIMATLGTSRILSVWSLVFGISENGNRHDGSQCWEDSHLLLKQDITPFTMTFGETMARWLETTFQNVLPKLERLENRGSLLAKPQASSQFCRAPACFPFRAFSLRPSSLGALLRPR